VSAIQGVANLGASANLNGIELRRSSIDLPHAQKPESQFDLIEVAPASLPETAVAVVLDLSDSSEPMQLVLSRLPTVLAKLPRKWPVWIYGLSDATPIVEAQSINVGHVIDGSIDLCSISADRTRRQAAAARGSFLGVVLEAIHERRAIESLDEAIVLVITDGRLTDFSPVSVLPGLRVLGLTENVDRSADFVWSQALPNHSLFRLNDPELDVRMNSGQQPLVGRCAVALEGDGCAESRCLTNDGSFQAIHGCEWDPRMRPLCLLVPAASSDLLTVVLSPTASGTPLRLKVSKARRKVSEQSMAAATAALQPTSLDHRILIDCSSGENGFEDMWKAVGAAAQLCEGRRRWEETLPAMQPILSVIHKSKEYQAALCLCRDDPKGPQTSTSRVVVIGLSQNLTSTINWGPTRSTPFGTPAEDWRMRYDQMEGRWMLSRNGQSDMELSPQGSEFLGALRLRDENIKVSILFSGDLCQV
jgi:hypothetical protein